MAIVDHELKEERLEVCRKCEFFEEKEIYNVNVKKCKACGCNLNIKAMIIRMKCPKDKWIK